MNYHGLPMSARTEQFYTTSCTPALRLPKSHRHKLVIVLAVLIALLYLITTTIISQILNAAGDNRNSCVILTLNEFGSASSFVSDISVSSVNPTTTPSLTVPLTGKSLCPPIPPNLSKYYETLHFTFLFCCLLVHTEACNETF